MAWFWYNATGSVLVYQEWSESVFSTLARFTLFGRNPEPPYLNRSTSAFTDLAKLRFPITCPVLIYYNQPSSVFPEVIWFNFLELGHIIFTRSGQVLFFWEPFQCCFIRANLLPFLLWKNGSGPDKTPLAQCNFREQDDSFSLPANCFRSSSNGRFWSGCTMLLASYKIRLT